MLFFEISKFICNFFQTFLSIRKFHPVIQGNLELVIYKVEVIHQSVPVSLHLPLGTFQIVEFIVSTGFRCGGGNFCLFQDPVDTFDHQVPHLKLRERQDTSIVFLILHHDVHTCQASHRSHIDHLVFYHRVPEPGRHQMLDGMEYCR